MISMNLTTHDVIGYNEGNDPLANSIRSIEREDLHANLLSVPVFYTMYMYTLIHFIFFALGSWSDSYEMLEGNNFTAPNSVRSFGESIDSRNVSEEEKSEVVVAFKVDMRKLSALCS